MSNTVLVLHAGNEEYGIPVASVQSIETNSSIANIDNLPEYMRGTVHVRNQLIPVFDLENILYGNLIEMNSESRIIIIQAEGFTYGLLVKETREILEISTDVLQQLELIVTEKTKYIAAFASLDQRIVTILDPVKMLEILEGIEKIQDYLQSQQETV